MIPFDFFYHVIHTVLLKKINSSVLYQDPTKMDSRSPFVSVTESTGTIHSIAPLVLFYDQEPLQSSVIKHGGIVTAHALANLEKIILVNSEISSDKNYILDKYNMQDVQYFYHAILCHEWYREYWFKNPEINFNFERTYITYNNLVLHKRLYRANLLVELSTRDMLDKGHVSFNSPGRDAVEKSAKSYYLAMPQSHKDNILNNLDLLDQRLLLDTEDIRGELSATINIPSLQSAFVNLVTETIYYENKVHLTEKVFKPIVAKTPFMLLAGAGNLAYLRKYGFKTFGDYWDESYDTIEDNEQRFDAVLAQLERLCNMSHSEQVAMKQDMAHILEYNYNHFYKTMRPIVVDELVSNLSTALDNLQLAYDPADVANLKRILTY